MLNRSMRRLDFTRTFYKQYLIVCATVTHHKSLLSSETLDDYCLYFDIIILPKFNAHEMV